MLSLLERVRVFLFTCYSTIFKHWLRAKPSFTKCPKVIDLKFTLQILLGLIIRQNVVNGFCVNFVSFIRHTL